MVLGAEKIAYCVQSLIAPAHCSDAAWLIPNRLATDFPLSLRIPARGGGQTEPFREDPVLTFLAQQNTDRKKS